MRLAQPFVIALGLSTLILTGCSAGTYRTLDQAGTEASLVAAQEMDGDWDGIGSTEVAADGKIEVDKVFGDSKEVSEACQTALGNLAAADTKPSAGAAMTLTENSGVAQANRIIESQVRTYDQAPTSPLRVSDMARQCVGTFKRGDAEGVGSVEVTAPTYDVGDLSALGLTVHSTTSTSDDVTDTPDGAVQIIAVARGNNLLTVAVSGVDQESLSDLMKDYLPKAVDKLEKTAG